MWLCDVELCCGSVEVLFFGDGDEVA